MRRRRLWIWVVVVAVSAAAVLAGSVAWTGYRAASVRSELLTAANLLGTLRRQLAAGELSDARMTLVSLQRRAGTARSLTAGVDWRVASRAPWLGDDLVAVRTVSEVVDDVSQRVLPPLVDLSSTLGVGALLPAGGRLELSSLEHAAPVLADVDAAARADRARVAAIGAGGLTGSLRTAVGELARGLDELLALTGTARRATALIPPMMGAHGPRTYLVLLQNPAEVRATGGMPGAFIVIRTDRGSLRLVDQGSAAAVLRVFAAPVLPLTPGQRALYTDRPGVFPADVNLSPHFPTAATLAREMYRRRSGTTVDGVLATDPVALSYLLPATGTLAVAGGPPLTAQNVVRVLLSDAYATLDQPTQDRYFAAVARAVFDRLSRGAADPGAALAGLARAAGERRLLLWSARPEEQAAVTGTVLDGTLPTDDGPRPTVGVFLNDGSGAKLDYYLTQAARLTIIGCRPDGSVALRLEVTLGSRAPDRGLSAAVLGLGLSGQPYTVRTLLMVFSPAGGSVVDLRMDGTVVPFGLGTERGRFVAVLTVDLRPGQTHTITSTLLTAPVPATAAVAPALWVTPGVNPWSLTVDSARVCAGQR